MMCEISTIIIQYFCGRLSSIGCEDVLRCVENKNSIFGSAAMEQFSVINIFDTYNIVDLMIYVYTLVTLKLLFIKLT